MHHRGKVFTARRCRGPRYCVGDRAFKMMETLEPLLGFDLRAGISVGSNQSSNENLGYEYSLRAKKGMCDRLAHADFVVLLSVRAH